MIGKGWFVIYGLLLLMVVYLLFAQAATRREVGQLQRQLAAAASPAPSPVPSIAPTSSPTPRPDTSSPQARDALRKADLGLILVGLDDFDTEKSTYPASLAELSPKYLEKLPTDPSGSKYTYRYQKTADGFRLTCFLEVKNDPDDAKDGKADQIYTLTEDADVPAGR